MKLILIGFLYLSYVGDPKTLWKWFEPYVKDDEWFLSAIPVNSWNIALSASSNLFSWHGIFGTLGIFCYLRIVPN
ncbi:hypothetical protein K1719_043856 [Acacia pycnantha]|nr:hypothetical protein K1719_043856 [Acacia pycnantha]